MNIQEVNDNLLAGTLDVGSLFPGLQALQNQPYVFKVDFGLESLPTEPGILMIRGPRQYGKSTWMEQQVIASINQHGAGSAFYLNGDYLANEAELETAILQLIQGYPIDCQVRRLFIDEITSIDGWEIVLKRLADRGELGQVLVVTTGSKATDLRRGAERLPGRHGRLNRTSYLFTPISYREFKRVCGAHLKENTLISYLIAGGSPVACRELAMHHYIPDYVIELVRQWIEGEVAKSGRSRSALVNIFSALFRFGGTPLGQAKLARETGLANNTVAQGYIELLNDLCCVVSSFPWDQHRDLLILRKPCKYHFINLLVAVAYNNNAIRTVNDFLALPSEMQGLWYEWLVAQEIARRNAILGKDILEPLAFWQNSSHEIDFVVRDRLIEVKKGQCTPFEFHWFSKQFPGRQLFIINTNTFKTDQLVGLTLEDFLLHDIH